jgi:predicted permease
MSRLSKKLIALVATPVFGSSDPCPNIAESLGDVWIVLLWPLYVVGCGLLVGYLAAELSGTPKSQIRSVLAACAFSNSTGLPITLLAVVHANFPTTTELGKIDPALFLSVYLLTYPILQWSIGGWLLAPIDEAIETTNTTLSGSSANPLSKLDTMDSLEDGEEMVPIAQHDGPSLSYRSLNRNVLNNKPMECFYSKSRRGMGETDASLYISEADLVSFGREQAELEADHEHASEQPESDDHVLESSRLLPPEIQMSSSSLIMAQQGTVHVEQKKMITIDEDAGTCWGTTINILSRVFQPPVLGAMAGITVASIPRLRGVFVDLVDRSDNAPLEWMFDGLYAVGLAAVPINMMILGVTLSQSHLSSSSNATGLMSSRTMTAIVIGKLLVLPVVGVASVIFCKEYLFHIPEDIDASVYLVLMIVFLTPTANNVMVMVELSGGAKESIARVIAWQYAVCPLILSLTMAISVGFASQWSS